MTSIPLHSPMSNNQCGFCVTWAIHGCTADDSSEGEQMVCILSILCAFVNSTKHTVCFGLLYLFQSVTVLRAWHQWAARVRDYRTVWAASQLHYGRGGPREWNVQHFIYLWTRYNCKNTIVIIRSDLSNHVMEILTRYNCSNLDGGEIYVLHL